MDNHVFDLQEYKNLKKLGDSLLTRSTKLDDLIGKIESEISEKDQESNEIKRALTPMTQKIVLVNFMLV